MKYGISGGDGAFFALKKWSLQMSKRAYEACFCFGVQIRKSKIENEKESNI